MASVEQKRFIAQTLIELTLRAFHLSSKDRSQISVEFVSHSREHAANRIWPSPQREANCLLEVLGHGLTEEQQRTFLEEATAMLPQILPGKSKGRLSRLLGIKAEAHRRIAFQFGELSPAVSEPYVVHTGSLAA
jgi:hypothetical protein